MRSTLICVLVMIMLAAGAGAAERPDTGTPEVTADTAFAPSVDSTMAATGVIFDEDGKQLYPMDEERRAKLISYSQFKNVWRFVSFFVTIGILLLILASGFSARLRDWAQVARKRFFVVWLFFVMFLLADYLLNLPFDIYRGFIVESNYGFMNQTFWSWWREGLLNLLVVAIIGIIPVWFFYLVVNRFRRWWLVFSIGAIPFAILFIVIAPVLISPLFNEFEPIEDRALETKLVALAERAGVSDPDVFQVDASKQSSKINAYVTGLFGSKRIVLYDTMIENFSHDEILYVMGHEMGHYVKQHIWWGLGLAIVFIMFSLWLTSKAIHPIITRYRHRFGFDRLGDIASLPLVLVFLTVISFVFQPITNTVSRQWEYSCDAYGIDLTGIEGDRAAVAFDKLAVFNLSDPDPHPLIEFWFYDHPALNKRIAVVREYAAAKR